MSDSEISMDPLTENRIDELPESIFMMQTKNDIVIDVPSGELPCSKSTSTKVVWEMIDAGLQKVISTEEKVLWEMIDVGLQKVSTDHLQDSARRSKYSWSIYKVEQNLKKVHEESTFHPKLISIGPFHHNKSEHLKLMEQHKWRFFSDFLKSMKLTGGFFLDLLESMKLTAASTGATTTTDGAATTTTDDDTTTTDDDTTIMTKKKQCLVAAMEKLEAKARACYSETFDDLGPNEFRIMMLLDGCFIIQLLLLFQKSGRNCRNDVDSIFSWRSRLPHLRHDLLLLENQLPFFVLQKIFEISGIGNEGYNLRDLILDFFNPVLYRENTVLNKCKKLKDLQEVTAHHLLHFFMSSFQTTEYIPIFIRRGGGYFPEYFPNLTRFKKKEKNQTGDPDQGVRFYVTKLANYVPDDTTGHHAQDMSIHCVTELTEAGIEFKKSDDHHDLLHIEFKEGKLHIPTLFIDDNTVPVLLNFIAYEQRHHSIKPYFTSYLMFLDYLVNSSKDVEHLHYEGIINHGLGSDEEVATLFNKLCKEVVLDLGDDNYLSKVFADVNQYFGKRRNRWRAAWKHEYFRTPWAFSSFLAAIVLIVLTFLQTYFSMYAYFRPPSN